MYRNRTQKSISKAKLNFYANKIRNLKSSDPSLWHRGIQLIANRVKGSPVINVPGISPMNNDGIANHINMNFAKITQSRPSIDINDLHAFLPAKTPCKIEEYVMYEQLCRINPYKSPGPDCIPNRIIKDFACELSIPLTDIFNTSLKDGVVPHIWKTLL
ncbi:uncharacterized protein LOC117118175 [Anneissia japonica]|uniref:uncharacterized protein LOC117118175 n=1 Tax=Anneissia japonica TaxID=1529436 RepID=UPI0014259A50|nr:uncharacterized protein LOC117118175 [Anneissia japonica]